MNWVSVFQLAAGMTTGLGAVCLIASYMFHLQAADARHAAGSLKGELLGEGLTSEAITNIVKAIADPAQQVEALRVTAEMAKSDAHAVAELAQNYQAKQLLEHKREDRSRSLRWAGILFLLFGVLAIVVSLATGKGRGATGDGMESSHPAVHLPVRSERAELTPASLADNLRQRNLFGWSLFPEGACVPGVPTTQAWETPFVADVFQLEIYRGSRNPYKLPLAGLAILPRDGKVLVAGEAGKDELSPRLEVITMLDGKPATGLGFREFVQSAKFGDTIPATVSFWDEAKVERTSREESLPIKLLEVKLVHDRATDLTWFTPHHTDDKSLANAYAVERSVNLVGVGGFSDWRLPTTEEVLTLLRKDGLRSEIPVLFGELPVRVWTADTWAGSTQNVVVDLRSQTFDAKILASLRLVRRTSAKPRAEALAGAIDIRDFNSAPSDYSCGACHFTHSERAGYSEGFLPGRASHSSAFQDDWFVPCSDSQPATP